MKDRARARARRSGSYATELEAEVLGEALDRVRPPVGFERRRRPTVEEIFVSVNEINSQHVQERGRGYIVAPAAGAGAVLEMAASVSGDINPLQGKLGRKWAFVPAVVGERTLIEDAAMKAVNHGRSLFTACFGAARKMIVDGKRPSVLAVCKHLGLPRATIYRRGKVSEIRAGIQEAVAELGGGGGAWGEQVERITGGGSRGRRVAHTCRDA